MGICHYARYTTALLLRDWASTPGGSWTNVPSRAEIEMNQRKTEAEIKKCAAKKDLGRFVVEAIENQARFLNRCAPLVHHTLSLDALLSVVVSAKVLARELVKSRKAKQRLYQTKANLRWVDGAVWVRLVICFSRLVRARAQYSGIEMQLTLQASMIKMQQSMAKSAKIMGMMNQVVKLPQVRVCCLVLHCVRPPLVIVEQNHDDNGSRDGKGQLFVPRSVNNHD
jgi:hypothetical protein